MPTPHDLEQDYIRDSQQFASGSKYYPVVDYKMPHKNLDLQPMLMKNQNEGKF